MTAVALGPKRLMILFGILCIFIIAYVFSCYAPSNQPRLYRQGRTEHEPSSMVKNSKSFFPWIKAKTKRFIRNENLWYHRLLRRRNQPDDMD